MIDHNTPHVSGRHPEYKHLVMCELEPHCGMYILTIEGYEGDALLSEDDVFNFPEFVQENLYGYITDEYIEILGVDSE